MAALDLPVRLRARMPGKIVTSLQLLGVTTLIARPRHLDAVLSLLGPASAVAIADYAEAGLRSLNGVEAGAA